MYRRYKELRFFRGNAWDFLSQKFGTNEPDVTPERKYWFRAFEFFPIINTKAVILGQDPYPGEGVADGLAFSTWAGNPIPASLNNIYKEYVDDLRLPYPRTSSLESWANEGVLLLNTCLTTRVGYSHAHRNQGWEKLAIEVISRLSERGDCVFILWGRAAQEYKGLVDEDTNLVLCAPHPSPLSARRGFFGSAPFSKCNFFLESRGIDPINWRLR